MANSSPSPSGLSHQTREPTVWRGCFTWTLILSTAAVLFFVNGVVIGMIHAKFAPDGPSLLREAKVVQILMFTGPLLLLVIQWWLFDLMSDWLSRLVRR